MPIMTVEELQKFADDYYRRQSARIRQLMCRTHIKAYVRREIVAAKVVEPAQNYSQAVKRLSAEPTFEAQIFKRDQFLSEKNRANSREPRRKSARENLSVKDLVAEFATRQKFATRKTKELWPPFFEELQLRGLNARKSKDGDSYTYAGKRKRVRISYRQFEKLVSKLAPRRGRSTT